MRVGQLAPVRRVLVAICALAAATIPLLAHPAAGQPAPNPRQDANGAAARYSDIETHYLQLDDQIAALDQKIQAGEARRAELRGIAQRRAAVAYKNAGADLGERALAAALGAARERHDYVKEKELAARLMKEYPKTRRRV